MRVTTDVIRDQVRRLSEGSSAWLLRYWLCRDSTAGGGQTYFLRAHLQVWHDGLLAGEEIEVTGGCGVDPLAALWLFDTVVRGAVFPAHLRDIVRDLTASWRGDTLMPPRVPLGSVSKLRAVRP